MVEQQKQPKNTQRTPHTELIPCYKIAKERERVLATFQRLYPTESGNLGYNFFSFRLSSEEVAKRPDIPNHATEPVSKNWPSNYITTTRV